MDVKYLGCDDEQAVFGRSFDPRPHLELGGVYKLVKEEVHTWHTLYFLKGLEVVPFNSVCFEKIEENN